MIIRALEAILAGIVIKVFLISSGEEFQRLKRKILENIVDNYHFYYTKELKIQVNDHKKLLKIQKKLFVFLDCRSIHKNWRIRDGI